MLAPTDLRLNPLYRLIFFGWAYTLLMFVIPFTVLIVVNTAVLLAIRRSNRLHAQSIVHGKLIIFMLILTRLVPVENSQTGRTERVVAFMSKKAADSKERQTTAVLIALVIVFLCCNTLAFLANIMVSFLRF